MHIPEHYPPILADIARLLHLRLRENLTADQAATLALACTDDLCLTFSGSQIYIPKQDAVKRAQRDQAIYQEFTGHNHIELARRHKLTVTQIYDVVARVRAAPRPATEGRPTA